MPARYTLADFQEAQQLVEQAKTCLEEQHNLVMWLTASGQDTEKAERLFEMMARILRQTVARRDVIAESIRMASNGAL